MNSQNASSEEGAETVRGAGGAYSIRGWIDEGEATITLFLAGDPDSAVDYTVDQFEELLTLGSRQLGRVVSETRAAAARSLFPARGLG